jgi:hypothetical protein
MALNVDQEWANFISSEQDEDSSDDTNSDIDYVSSDISKEVNFAPKASAIYISTKTKIAYLNTPIDLKPVFWQIPVLKYATPSDGVVKKQIKLNSTTVEDLNFIQERLKTEPYFEEHVITSINNPTGRITFKDIRKISIGISKKDLTSYRCKKKSAFYNCFVLIFRMKIEDAFKEFHVKVFNTGKLEMPGVQNEGIFKKMLDFLIVTMQPYIETKLECASSTHETVLINSNFKCGFYINRERLYDILKYKYNIQAIYDPCSYPGIQCKFYYNPDVGVQTGSQISAENKALYVNVGEVSFMIFRTGSVLIVGKCDEDVLLIIYEFLKTILTNEYTEICQKNAQITSGLNKEKKKKIRKKIITVSI